MRYIMGVDVGKNGGLVLLDNQCKIIFKAKMPIVPTTNEVDYKQWLKIILSIKKKYVDVHAFIEKVHAMPKQGVSGMFTFGYNAGALEMSMIACGIPYMLVTPQSWQAFSLQGIPELQKTVKVNGKDSTKKNVKAMSLMSATRLFPDEDFLFEGSKKPHDGAVDASLIAYWGLMRAIDN